ncbi:MAG: selenoneine biosynthesis selenosugar synthase SenB [Pirellulaceae bacterium]|jgi:putative glycosyltransferase (TIGR04348 family)|nr:selenoneine biosynthesis selenosugar synthase SenB [Pirellulaceae bacterium]HJN08103.1 selenoneine biosynthesis selenosugar synthase SenB [Pirellulaceae bacterium]
MRIVIVTPAATGSRKGNRITASRWRMLLRENGHRVTVADAYVGQSCDVVIALHAKKSAESIHRFATKYPDRPLVVALTGTDLYRDIATSRAAQRSLDMADRLVLLQPDGKRILKKRHQPKVRVIYQSVPKVRPLAQPLKTVFEVTVIGHLRAVKDPFRAALAARRLSADSKVRIVHCGQALNESMRSQAEREMSRNHRYRWLGDLPRWQSLRRLSRSRLMVLSSRLEGGANVVSEALACQVPILSSRISGSIGLLGAGYPGYFETGDTRALTELLRRAECDAEFYRGLADACRDRQWLIEPRLERDTWEALLAEFS